MKGWIDLVACYDGEVLKETFSVSPGHPLGLGRLLNERFKDPFDALTPDELSGLDHEEAFKLTVEAFKAVFEPVKVGYLPIRPWEFFHRMYVANGLEELEIGIETYRRINDDEFVPLLTRRPLKMLIKIAMDPKNIPVIANPPEVETDWQHPDSEPDSDLEYYACVCCGRPRCLVESAGLEYYTPYDQKPPA